MDWQGDCCTLESSLGYIGIEQMQQSRSLTEKQTSDLGFGFLVPRGGHRVGARTRYVVRGLHV